MKNYSWYNFVKITKEYSVKLEECHNGFSLMRTINNFKPSCIALNKQFESMANSLAWYAELYNIRGEKEDSFLNRIHEFKDQKIYAENYNNYSFLWIVGGTLATIIGATVPWMSYIACSSCYNKFTDKPFVAAATISATLLSTGLGMIFYGSDLVESGIIYRDEDLIDSYLELAKVIENFEYKPSEALTQPQSLDSTLSEL